MSTVTSAGATWSVAGNHWQMNTVSNSIDRTAQVGEDIQEIVVLFHDFAFRNPEEILAGLRRV
jgi:hypothetical protein